MSSSESPEAPAGSSEVARHPSSRELVRCIGLGKDYASKSGMVRALEDVTLTICEGEFVAIVGASGSGKSTLLNVLGCLDLPTRGRYELAGVDIGMLDVSERAIVRNRLLGFVFQAFNLLPRMTALDNCELPLQYRGVPRKDRRARAVRALDAVGLGARIHHRPLELSGGQQQRVAIARALVTDPPLLLADEPTGNLDTRTSYEVLALLRRLNRELGVTVVLVTHEQDIAACTPRVVTMRDGRVVEDRRVQTPHDPEALLAALPVAHDDPVAVEASTTRSAARHGVLQPALLSGAAGLAAGAALGALLSWTALGRLAAVVPGVGAIVGSCFVSAGTPLRTGQALSGTERSALALGCTTALGALSLPAAWLTDVRGLLPATLWEDASPRPLLLVVFVAVAFVTIWLAHWLLIGLFTPAGTDDMA